MTKKHGTAARQGELEELERTDPEVRAAREKYDATVQEILAKRARPPAPTLKILAKCQVEGCSSTDARERTYFSKVYSGPCGDSFCFASCDMSTCREQRAVLCDEHLKALAKPTTTLRRGEDRR